MTEKFRRCCPGCSIPLIIDSPFNLLAGWCEMLERYGFRSVGLGGGWQDLGLPGTVSLEGTDLEKCDAIYIGDLITPETSCPRCGYSVQCMLKELN